MHQISFGQADIESEKSFGINLLQIPATTIDFNYQYSNNPIYNIIVNAGYTINYQKSFDGFNMLLTPHCKCANNGYNMITQNGAFVKAGLTLNFRKTFKNEFRYSNFKAN